MKNNGVYFFFVVCVFALTSCAGNMLAFNRTLQVTVYSDPVGATIYEDGRSFGPAPVTLKYNVTPEQYALGTISVRGVSARWVSGAEASIPSLQINFNNGLQQIFSFKRPVGYPNIGVDANYAIQIQNYRLQLQQEQARKDRCNQIAKSAGLKFSSQPYRGAQSGFTRVIKSMEVEKEARNNCLAGISYTPPAMPQPVQRNTVTNLPVNIQPANLRDIVDKTRRPIYRCNSSVSGNLITTKCVEQ